MGTITAKADTIVTMARTIHAAHEQFAAFTPQRHELFKPDYRAFGGVTAGPYSDDLSVTYVPMSVTEYENAKGVDLADRHDTGGARSTWDSIAGEFSSFADAGISEDARDEWDDFYAAGGRRSGEDACGYNTRGKTYSASSDDAPWARPLKESWDTAIDNRLHEVKIVRAELGYLMTKLIAAARKYAHIDLENARDIKGVYDDAGSPYGRYGSDGSASKEGGNE